MDTKKILTNPVAVSLLALLTCALWGSAFPAIKIGFSLMHIETVGSKILYAGTRFMMAGIMTVILASIIEKRFVIIKKSSIPAVCTQGLIQTTIQYIAFYIGLSFTSGAKASVINGGNTFFSIIVAHFLVKGEKINARKIIGCVIGFLGIIIINMKDGNLFGDFSFAGEGMILICTATYGTSSVTTKIFSKLESPGALAGYELIFGSSLLLIIGFLAGGHLSGFTVKSALLLFYLALLSTISFYLWAALLKYNSVSKVTVFGLTVPIFGVLLSALALGEKVMTLTNVVALLLVCGGIVIVNRMPKNEENADLENH